MAESRDTNSGAALVALSDAVGAVAGELDVETVLQLIVDRVRSLVGAQYAALGIVDEHRRIEKLCFLPLKVHLRPTRSEPEMGMPAPPAIFGMRALTR